MSLLIGFSTCDFRQVWNGADQSRSSMMARHSGLQLQVLALFKTALRVAKQKDQALLKEGAEAVTQSYRSGGTYRFVRERFRDDAFSVDRMNFAVIEHLLRKGQRDLKMLEQMKTASFANVPR